jgi:hypothetical protein
MPGFQRARFTKSLEMNAGSLMIQIFTRRLPSTALHAPYSGRYQSHGQQKPPEFGRQHDGHDDDDARRHGDKAPAAFSLHTLAHKNDRSFPRCAPRRIWNGRNARVCVLPECSQYIIRGKGARVTVLFCPARACAGPSARRAARSCPSGCGISLRPPPPP